MQGLSLRYVLHLPHFMVPKRSTGAEQTQTHTLQALSRAAPSPDSLKCHPRPSLLHGSTETTAGVHYLPRQTARPWASLEVNCSLISVQSRENGENECNFSNKVAVVGYSRDRHRQHPAEAGAA